MTDISMLMYPTPGRGWVALLDIGIAMQIAIGSHMS